MSDAAHQVKDAKGYVDKVQKGAKAISDEAKAAKKLQDEGATLSELQSAVATLTWMSKVSAGLDALSVGLSIVQSFLPDVPTVEDQILDTVNRLEGEVASLRADMERRFYKTHCWLMFGCVKNA